MRLFDEGKASRGNLVEIRGRVEWERRVRPSERVFVAVPEEHSDTLAHTSDWLLLAGLLPAIHHGEPRLLVEGAVSALLLEHLDSAMSLLSAWYGDAILPIDAAETHAQARRPGTGLFFSGGVDSTASLIRYITAVPTPTASLRYAINADLLALDKEGLRAEHRAILAILEPVVEGAAVPLLPVATNIRSIEDNEFRDDWMYRAHGAVLAAIGHALAGGID